MRIMFGLAAVFMCAACNTPAARIEDNQALYDTYTAEDQAAIKSGQIRKGFDQTQVFMALGKPTKKQSDAGGEQWVWLKQVRRTITVKKDVTKYALEQSEYELGKRAQPPSTEDQITQNRTQIKKVIKFQNGKVVSWEDPSASYEDEWH